MARTFRRAGAQGEKERSEGRRCAFGPNSSDGSQRCGTSYESPHVVYVFQLMETWLTPKRGVHLAGDFSRMSVRVLYSGLPNFQIYTSCQHSQLPDYEQSEDFHARWKQKAREILTEIEWRRRKMTLR
eukprot:7502694-Pyramimonas_sp.AAC.1